ncbi:DUF551 domain-containing protein [Cronobacter sakazakii]
MSTISNEVLEKLSVRYRLLAKIHDGNESQAWEESALIVEELLALRKEREQEEPFVCPKCGNTGLADSGGVQPWGEPILIECDCTAPPAPGADDDSLPYDPQIAEYEQMMEAEQAQADTTSQQFESLAGKAPDGWIPCGERLPPIAQMVLVHHENDYDFGMVINGHFKIFIMDTWLFFDGVKTAHWQPLPEPPCK